MRAGQRTYYFDVKATRKGQLYITITENRKKGEAQGDTTIERHKIFVYPEDLSKFSEALTDAIQYCFINDPESHNTREQSSTLSDDIHADIAPNY